MSNQKPAQADYDGAISCALGAFVRFYQFHNDLLARIGKGGMSPEIREAEYSQQARLAEATCAQQELICMLFGVSDEKVHDDLANLAGL